LGRFARRERTEELPQAAPAALQVRLVRLQLVTVRIALLAGSASPNRMSARFVLRVTSAATRQLPASPVLKGRSARQIQRAAPFAPLAPSAPPWQAPAKHALWERSVDQAQDDASCALQGNTHLCQMENAWCVLLAHGACHALPSAALVLWAVGATRAHGTVQSVHRGHTSWRPTQLASPVRIGIGASNLQTVVSHLVRASGTWFASAESTMRSPGLPIRWARTAGSRFVQILRATYGDTKSEESLAKIRGMCNLTSAPCTAGLDRCFADACRQVSETRPSCSQLAQPWLHGLLSESIAASCSQS